MFDVSTIQAAAVLIGPYVVRTPLVESAVLNRRVGGRVLFKAEMLQRTGSFKFRGACHRILKLAEAERRGGVLAWSSGNHALAVATMCAELGIAATIVMPTDTPAPKQDGVKAAGATIRFYDRRTEVREEIGLEIAARTGAVIVPPYDHEDIMAGQGTAGLEIVSQAEALGVRPDLALCGASGGGLIGGIGTAMRSAWPDLEVWVVEPEGFDDVGRSLRAGERVGNVPGPVSICDALMAPMPGEVTFPVHRRVLSGGVSVSDDEVRAAMRVVFADLKLVVEPGGCVGLAALLSGRVALEGRTAVVMLSGGNVEAGLFAGVLEG